MEQACLDIRRMGGFWPWRDDTPWKPVMAIKADTFKTRRLFDISNAEVGTEPDVNELSKNEYRDSPKGTWRYSSPILPKGTFMATWYGTKRGVIVFDGDVAIPMLHIRRDRDRFDDNPFMSLTPAEFLSMREGIMRARGATVIAGLGMGHALIEISLKKTVDTVTVVEIDKELVDWLMPAISKYADMDKVEIIVGDAYKEMPKLSAEYALIDIFKHYAGDNIVGFNKLKYSCKKIARMWAWGVE